MKQEEHVFYKSVRADYTSVCMPKGVARKYTIGKSYRFDKRTPAFVYVPDASTPLTLPGIFVNRPEPDRSSRVLICRGNLFYMKVPCFVYVSSWKNLTFTETVPTRLCWVSTRFTVIGELPIAESGRREKVRGILDNRVSAAQARRFLRRLRAEYPSLAKKHNFGELFATIPQLPASF